MTLKELYESLEAADIRQWVTEGRQEDLNLEFKLAPRSLGTADERKVLAKAVSAFANSAGGLVVWGVDARRDVLTGIDAAVAAVPLVDPAVMLSRLNEHTSRATTPPAPGVIHRLTAGREFAITHVPESDLPPHMAKLGHDNCYFKRSGGSSYRMEHFDLADMFGRRQKPDLRVAFSRATKATTKLRVEVTITNTGRASARAPFLAIRITGLLRDSDFGVDGNGRTGLARLTHNAQDARFGGDTVIHPMQTIEVTRLEWSAPPGASENVLLEYDIAALDVPIQTWSAILSFENGALSKVHREPNPA